MTEAATRYLRTLLHKRFSLFACFLSFGVFSFVCSCSGFFVCLYVFIILYKIVFWISIGIEWKKMSGWMWKFVAVNHCVFVNVYVCEEAATTANTNWNIEKEKLRFFFPRKQNKPNKIIIFVEQTWMKMRIEHTTFDLSILFIIYSASSLFSLSRSHSLSLSIFLCLSVSHCTLSSTTVSHAKKNRVFRTRRNIFSTDMVVQPLIVVCSFFICVCVCVEGLSIIIMMKLSMWDVSRKLLPVR